MIIGDAQSIHMTSKDIFCFQMLKVSDRKTVPMMGAFLCFLLHLIVSRFYKKICSSIAPPNQKSPDFDVPASYSRTHDGEEFRIYDAAHAKLGGRLMIFSTKVLIEMLCATEVILVDGTFETRPMMLAQVYVVMRKHLEEGACLLCNQFSGVRMHICFSIDL